MASRSTPNRGYGVEESSDMDVSSGEEDNVLTLDASARSDGGEGVDLSSGALARKLRQHVNNRFFAHQLPVQPKVEHFLPSQSSRQAPQSNRNTDESYATAAKRNTQRNPIVISDDEDDMQDNESEAFFTPPSSPTRQTIDNVPAASIAKPAAPSNHAESSSAALYRAKKAQEDSQALQKLRQQVQNNERENAKYRKLLSQQQKQQVEIEKQLLELKSKSESAEAHTKQFQDRIVEAMNTVKDLKTQVLRIEASLSMKTNQSRKKKQHQKRATISPSPIKKPNKKMSKKEIALARKNSGECTNQHQHGQRQGNNNTEGRRTGANSVPINEMLAAQGGSRGARRPSASDQHHASNPKDDAKIREDIRQHFLPNGSHEAGRYINKDVVSIAPPATAREPALDRDGQSAAVVSPSQAKQVVDVSRAGQNSGRDPGPAPPKKGTDVINVVANDVEMDLGGGAEQTVEEGEIVQNEQSSSIQQQRPPAQQTTPASTSSSAFRPYQPVFSSFGIRATVPTAPKQALCPAEGSGGVCRDTTCPYTHFSDYKK